MQDWIISKFDDLTATYGTVPPPWVVFDEHPYSICWRMGAGESHLEVWWEWWTKQNFSENQKIEYFRLHKPPNCWLLFLIEAIWEVDVYDKEKNLTPFFNKTRELGFGSQDDYEREA